MAQNSKSQYLSWTTDPYSMKKKTEQIDKFVQAAKEHGCDESEKAFADKLKKISSQKTNAIPKVD
jgi:hypothetical protein